MTTAELVKARLDVVTLVSGYLKLDKAGINFKARCPFHNERTPSFFVSPARESWHCFGCSKGGDIFSFVMEIDGLTFPEALRMLAERVGVEISFESSREQSLRAKLFEVVEEAAKFFEEQLASHTGARAYLKERGLAPETVKEFRIGFAPDSWRALSEHLKRNGYSDDEMQRAGLTVPGSRGAYDRFRSRIIFPLEDAQGRVIGFGGRIFPEVRPLNDEVGPQTAGGKYINTPQTELYDKSRFLYGFSKGKHAIRAAKNAVVVEGYMDLILSYQSGVTNAVAVSGTAMTREHLKNLRRTAEALTFAFDIDSAGVEASRRAVGLAFAEDFTVRIVDIEGGKDPADIAAKDSVSWQKMVEGATNAVNFFLKKAVSRHVSGDATSKRKIGEEVLPLVSAVANEIERAHWVRELARILKISEEALWRELAKYALGAEPEKATVAAPEVQALTRKARLEERIAGLILVEPRLAVLGELPQPLEAELASTEMLFEHLQKRAVDATVDQFFEALPPDLKQYASRLAFEAEAAAMSHLTPEEEFLELLHAWRELAIKKKLTRIKHEIEALEQSGDSEASHSYMREFQELTAHLATIISLHGTESKKEKS
ncbi:MAG: DNA primase [Candidatus Ryanbacteria bacterium]|nr:DNA primase [Candidatus Ryanbacteria bacterium]